MISNLTKTYIFQTALEIAKKGGTVHMVCRNPKYAEEAQKEIQDVSNSDKIHVHILDMSDPKAVFKFANGFDEPLNVLINNAGCMVNERTLTEEGLEKNFATNTLGKFLFIIFPTNFSLSPVYVG